MGSEPSATVRWHISTRSGNGQSCVEVGMTPLGDTVYVRHSKDRQGPVLTFTSAEWKAFLSGVDLREFDLPTTHA
ncbi:MULTISPECIES: DUF397 domain-containing protein [unclassified Nonomuraea]|uniref:DUF397 domain-containing protein n=1 Tax=unclassified Nonomuraea TaxID=2593643 RepID=UPI0033CE9BAC